MPESKPKNEEPIIEQEDLIIVETESSSKAGVVVSIILSVLIVAGLSLATFQYLRKRSTGSQLLKEAKNDFVETEQPAFDANDLIRNRKDNDADSVVGDEDTKTLGNDTLKSARVNESVAATSDHVSKQVGEQIDKAIADN